MRCLQFSGKILITQAYFDVKNRKKLKNKFLSQFKIKSGIILKSSILETKNGLLNP